MKFKQSFFKTKKNTQIHFFRINYIFEKNQFKPNTMRRLVFISALFCGILILSCQKNDSTEISLTPSSLNMISDDAQVTHFIDQIISSADFYSNIDEPSQLKSGLIDAGCAIVTRTNVQGVAYPVTVTIDFGKGCTGSDGKIKTGKMTIVKTAPWKDVGAKRTVTFENHTVDGVKIEGTQVSTNNGNQTFTWAGTITMTKADNTFVTRTETRTRQYIKGFDTPSMLDDEIVISGSSTVTKSDKSTYSRTITTSLVKKGDCDFFVAGVVKISKTVAGKEDTYTLNYGTGACDNKATVTRGTVTKEIVLKK